MSLNGLAGAGQSKTAILESKGIFEEKPTGEFQFLGGIFNRKKPSSKPNSGSSSPKKPEITSNAVKEKEREAGVVSEPSGGAQAIKATGEQASHNQSGETRAEAFNSLTMPTPMVPPPR